MDSNSNITIQLVNVENHETFNYPLVIVKGYVFGCENDNHNDCVIIHYLDTEGNVTKTFSIRLQNAKFSMLLDLKLGNNDYLIQYQSANLKLSLSHILSSCEFVVCPMYIICEGKEPRHNITRIKNKIHNGCSLIQTLIAETLHQCGFRRKTFSLLQDNGNNGCVIFRSKLNCETADHMTSEELWEYFGREIMTSEYGSHHRKYLSFVYYGKSKFRRLAIGGGGLALCSAEYIHTWPESIDDINDCLANETLTNLTHNLNQNCENYLSASLGAVCHELCHTFDLGHTNDGIMGRDFDRVGIVFALPTPNAFYSESNKLQKFNCIRSKKDSLIICEGTTSRKLNISYSVTGTNLMQNFTGILKNCDLDAENVTYHKRNINNVFPNISFWSNGCATLLAYHKWMNRNDLKNKNNIKSNEQFLLQYDSVRNIVTSQFGIVVVQLRNHNGYVKKSWEFSGKKRKTLFLVPICESRKADSIVIQDSKGNLLKKDIEHFLNNVSF